MASQCFYSSWHLKINASFLSTVTPFSKQFDPWDVECLLSLLESWAAASSTMPQITNCTIDS